MREFGAVVLAAVTLSFTIRAKDWGEAEDMIEQMRDSDIVIESEPGEDWELLDQPSIIRDCGEIHDE